jgi:hypothetical protein
VRVLFGAGHRHTLHTDGGPNPYEQALNGKKVRAILDHYDRHGGKDGFAFELRCYTPDRGLGMFPGYLNQAPVSGFPGYDPQLMIELHSEGVNDTGVRGGFVIYPDWGDDVDEDVQAHGHIFSSLLMDKTGIPVRWSSGRGTMSEKRTGVGLQGYRLGVFRDTAGYAARCTRLIFEQGAHSSPHDRAIMDDPAFLARQAECFLAAVSGFFDLSEPGWRRQDRVYADPIGLPFNHLDEQGARQLNGCPVYLYQTVVTSLKRIIPRSYAGDGALQSAEALPEGMNVPIFGEVITENGRKWYFLRDGSRVQARHFTPELVIRHRG